MTQPTPANDNDQRPAEYDAALVRYQNLMRKKANMYVGRDKADDLVADTCLRALRRWRMYNPAYNMGTWLLVLMRNVMHDQKNAANALMRRGRTVDADNIVISSQPNQEQLTELSQVMSALPDGREGEILLRLAMGEELAEVGVDYGISRERVRQLGEKARNSLRKRLATDAVAKLAKEAA